MKALVLRSRHLVLISSRVMVCLAIAAGVAGAASDNALEDYVRAPDASFAWKHIRTTNVPGGSVVHLEVTSQTWRDHLWTHNVQVFTPAALRQRDIAFLLVSGDGSGRSSLWLLTNVASSAGAVAAVVTRVPNQPLYSGRKEDALIAYTFDQYLKTGDRTWPLLFPMVKSAVRAMDAVEQWAARERQQKIERWVVSGASKRGWTTWLTGAVDPRVKAIAPMVIDMLNMKAQTDWARAVYGRQSEQIHDYTELGLIEKMGLPEMVTLRGWVDPYSFRNRYTLPKLILLGTNDPYWTVDSLRHYWSDLPAPKFVHQTANAGHDLGGGREAVRTLAAFFDSVATANSLPQLEWTITSASTVHVTLRASETPQTVRLWTADSPDRDLRNDRWRSREIEVAPGAKEFDVTIPPPSSGYRAFMLEAAFRTRSGQTYSLSTEARVTPDDVKVARN